MEYSSMMCKFRTSMGNTMMRRILRNKKASARRMASQIVTLSGLTRLKSALGSKYRMLSLINIRASTLWTPFDGRIFRRQKGVEQNDTSVTSLKLIRVQRINPQIAGR